ncbi:hypothetical protein VNO77_03240 [Canavalia gladiata]|uniref:Uncharacterized protein n=1 Tax=Canavalia gladiata TaxID=3824 RepID=A0AAN9N0T9_CANGL
MSNSRVCYQFALRAHCLRSKPKVSQQTSVTLQALIPNFQSHSLVSSALALVIFLTHVLGIKLGHCPKPIDGPKICIDSLVQGSGQVSRMASDQR